ncbi:hypothetical protein Pmani_033737 [Petrolisthes manimaculis]|uniref:BTB domain-containing protein n=1 Tax=Petrolisthes manimaculis TaxID=1843537 RepID=A0AAE1TQ39_9EUCA|nr:hypothetical protein Pmani_033737 [Petrolisthes manimaculis]
MITLVAEGRQFLCCKAKLMASSDYFRAMFSNNFTENAKNVIELQGIDADCLQLLIQYVESGSYAIPNENILALLQTSAMLQFVSIQAACEHQILASLNSSSCLEVYYVTSALGLVHLASAALTVAVWKFTDIALTPQFLQLAFYDLVEYVSHPALYPGTEGEWKVWEALVSWILENEEERQEHLVQLILCLDLHAFSQQDLSNMLFYSVVSDNDEAQQVIQFVKNYKMNETNRESSKSNLSSDSIAENMEGSSAKNTTSELTNNLLTEMTDTSELTETSIQNVSDTLTKEMTDSTVAEMSNSTMEMSETTQRAVMTALRRGGRKVPQVPCVVGFKHLGVAAAHRKHKAKNSDDEEEEESLVWPSLFARNSEISPVLYSFDPVTLTLAEEVTLSKICEGPRQCSGYQVCAVGPSIYILGGEFQLGHGNWNLGLWRYSTASRKWIYETSLPQPRRHHMACVLGSVIYLLGGFGRHRVRQSSVDAYDTESGEWLRCPDMPHCISHGAVCAFMGRLMVFTPEMQLLTYYPSTRKWSAIPLTTPNKAGYRAALPWMNSIFLIDKCSTQVYKFLPDNGYAISCVGRFIAPPVNVCLIDGKIYSFSQDDLKYCHIIEVLDISSKDQLEQEQERGKSERNVGESPMSSKKKGEISQSRFVAQEIWRGQEPDKYMFTTKCPAEDTFSLGTFPLLRVKA